MNVMICSQADLLFQKSIISASFSVVDRNALNIVKDDLIARVDELTRSVLLGLILIVMS